jgi:hypothetical protein
LRLRFRVSVETAARHQVLEWAPHWPVRAASQIFRAEEDGRAERRPGKKRPVHLRGYHRPEAGQRSVWQKAIVLSMVLHHPKYRRRVAEQRLVWRGAIVLSMVLHHPKYRRRVVEQRLVWEKAIALSKVLRPLRYRHRRMPALFSWLAQELAALEERVVRAEAAAERRGDNRKLHGANQASIPYARK